MCSAPTHKFFLILKVATYLSRGIQMCVSQPVVVHLKLEDSINIRKLELNTIFSSYIKKRQALMFSDSITQLKQSN